MAKNLSEVFRETNKILWNGDAGSKCKHTPFICITIMRLKSTKSSLLLEAKSIISSRLGKDSYGRYHTVETWLDENNICNHVDQDNVSIQTYRKAWLTELEKEFAHPEIR